MYNKGCCWLWLSKAVRGMSGPLVLVTQYEPTSQMQRAAVEPSCHLQREMSHVRQAASSQDETRGSKEHDSSRTLFDFRFPAPLPNYSIIRFQKGLDSAPGNDRLAQRSSSESSKLPKRPRIHTTTLQT
jgi:hypothetical protein